MFRISEGLVGRREYNCGDSVLIYSLKEVIYVEREDWYNVCYCCWGKSWIVENYLI